MDAILKTQAEQLTRDMATQASTVDDLNDLLRGMRKTALERLLNTEMDVHLGRRQLPATADAGMAAEVLSSVGEPAAPTAPQNRRNGHSQKTVRGDRGNLTLRTPRDRHGTFEPQLIAKPQRRLPGLDDKILALDAKGLTTRDLQEIVQELYGVEVSPPRVREITADLDADVTAWRTQRLDAV